MAKTNNDPSIQVLFRYRDLVARTLEKHRNVISKQRACWWGWWKRPSEDSRRDVWDLLRAELVKSGSVYVGLFDSGDELDETAVRLAKVTGIIPPSDDIDIQPPVPEAEEELVPSYYRKSSYSRAWLKLEEIRESPMPFFKEYTFEVAPPLHGYPQSDLKELEGKLVTDGKELRGMDATIWRVRRKKQGDRDERVVFSRRGPSEPVSCDPMRVKSNKILHLTDLHFAVGENRKQHTWGYPGDDSSKTTMADAVGSALQQPSNEGVGLVIVTGDLTFVASQEEFEEASKSIHLLLGTLNLGPESLVIIPGNHDIAWTNRTDGYDPSDEVTAAPVEATAAYRKFYTGLMKHSPNDDLSMGRRFVMPSGVVVDICALNSSSLEQGQKYLTGMGRVGEGAFDRVCNGLGWSVKDGTLSLRILAIHHHLTATEDVESPAEYRKGFGMAIDAKENLRKSARLRVHLALHGHRHRTFIWREGVYALPDELEKEWRLGDVSLLGGGTVGSPSVGEQKNYFNLLTVDPQGITVDLFRSKNRAAFEDANTWTAPFALDDRGLRLEDWSIPPRPDR